MKQITTEKLTVGYQKKVVVDDVSVVIPTGKITALLGPNGCGKSTFLKTLARILKPVSGHVLIESQNVDDLSSKMFARQLALLPQSQLPPEGITVREAVSYGRSPYSGIWGQLSEKDWQYVDSAMKATGITELMDRKVTDLSGGQCQRVWLALTLAQDSDYILLDEPTTYLDLNHQVELMKLLHTLKAQKKTIVTVLHDINQACRYCDHLIVMKDGQVMDEGSPESVLTTDLLSSVFSLDAEIHRDPVARTPVCVVR
ncbi:Fe(3+) dicitrate ABC transporter ATP-binding protein FecE [Vibrio salinus]|uniref:Fe(3+) dicitrate ABC transporter ATP-binding protein FecE n=1 Tax=Vibrio salinus TaxID=2899784 RepID=UPI001E531F78|nr:Fe(3+) dicitrate ABC transporter ATP-binding protein FecE [Vibrio salinus]MCE0496113.1 Fe(3+) dicitrate ABC transporter ATP-binding protein FecE [Vibrio salinus]